MHSASHSDILLVSATLVVIAVVAGFLAFQVSPDLQYRHEVVFEPRAQAESLSNNELQNNIIASLPQDNLSTDEYQEKIRDLLSTYNSETLNYFSAETVYQYNLDQLLSMSVPSGYQQLHFDLVIAFESLHSAVNGVIEDKPASLSDLEAAREKMDLLLQQHSWIQQ